MNKENEKIQIQFELEQKWADYLLEFANSKENIPDLIKAIVLTYIGNRIIEDERFS